MSLYSSSAKKQCFNRIIVINFLLLCLIITGGYCQNNITIPLVESQDAFKNPLKGFRGGEFRSLEKDYIKWSDLENSESDGVQKIRDICNNRWKNCPSGNYKIIPRIYLAYNGNFWPADMQAGDYTSQQFKDRLVRLLSRLGEVWDNDPRVAFVEMGIIGEWGEQEQPAPTPAMQRLVGDAFSAAFKNKLIMVRHVWDMFTVYPFGCYWDSWAHWDQLNHYISIASTAPRWKIAPMGGECAYDWGNVSIQPGTSPDNTLSEPVHRNYLLKSIRELHGNHAGWVSNYTASNATVKEGAIVIQKAFGHRFVIKEATYPRRIIRGQPFDVSFSVVNTGSSPFYYKWPVEVSLLDKTTKQPVYQRLFGNVDVTQWMPGDNWDSAGQVYKTPPVVYEAQGRFSLPLSLAAGQYILALAMLDPAGLKPANRFAIKNYFTGGRHPIGYVGVDQDVSGSYTIDPVNFNSLTDNTLQYESALSVRYTLNLNAPNGITDPGAGTLYYYAGTSVTIVALPGQNQTFINWTGDVEGNATLKTMTITMDKSKTITANFGKTAISFNPIGTHSTRRFLFSMPGYGPLHFSQLSGIQKVIVYDLSGISVRTMEVTDNHIFWNCADNSGHKVPRGIYIVNFEGIDKSHSIRMATTH